MIRTVTPDPNYGFDHLQAVADGWAENPFHFGVYAWGGASVFIAVIILSGYVAWKWKEPAFAIIGLIFGVAVLVSGFYWNDKVQSSKRTEYAHTQMSEWAKERYGLPLSVATVQKLSPETATGNGALSYLRAGELMTAVQTATGIKLYSVVEENGGKVVGKELPLASGITDAAS